MAKPRGAAPDPAALAGWETAKAFALALPGVEEGTSFGTPSLRVRGKFLARLREEGGLVLKINLYERDLLLEMEPELFYVIDHYRDYPAVLVRLTAITPERLRQAVEDSWRFVAPPRLVAEFDRRHPTS